MSFTPVEALAGGALIGLASSMYWLGQGRVLGVSGLLGELFRTSETDRADRAIFLAGLVVAGLVFWRIAPSTFEGGTSSLVTVAIAGVLVGFGTRLGNGCTSGHGVCGLSRFSLRSLVATLTFMAAAMVTVFVVRHVAGVR